jgi:hypothetical protein
MKDLFDHALEEFDDPENHCTVCGDLIEVKSGVVPLEGEEYYIFRENREDEGYAMIEKHIHGDCLQEYLEESEED